ncbi:MAG: TlpA disulfide reductase family protein [Bacteroidota bacterium]
MKKINLLLLSLFVFLSPHFLSAQETKQVTINGTIDPPVEETVVILNKDFQKLASAKVKEGSFTLSFKLEEASPIVFSHGEEIGNLFLEPGDEVELYLNPQEFDETLKLSGPGSEESNYLLSKYLLEEKHELGFADLNSKPLDDFLKTAKEINQIKQDHFGAYIKSHSNLNSDFLENEKFSLGLELLSQKLTYPLRHKFLLKKEVEHLPSDYYSFVDAIDLNDEKRYKINQDYANFISSYISVISTEEGEDLAYLDGVFNHTKAKISSPYIQESLLYLSLVEYLKYFDVAGTEKYVEDFKEIAKNEKYVKEINKLYQEALALAKGKPAPSFTYLDTEGKEVSLESFRGKYVYIDVWATWCGPCLAEMPALKEIEEAYHENEEIVFLGVSIDQQAAKDKWLKMIADKGIGGVQLLADKDWKSSIVKDYLIEGIPKYVLVDKEGNILDREAPRPSNPELKEILEDLVGQ